MRDKLLLALAIGAAPVASAVAKQPKNVVLILMDDMSYHYSAIGTPGLSTPNMDKLHNSGMSFTNAFSACSSSAPSRSSILSGMYPHANGHWRNTHTLMMDSPEEDFVYNTPMRDVVGVHEWVRTLPEMLSENGQFSAIMHKYHLSYPWKYRFDMMCGKGNTPEVYHKDMLSIVETADKKPFFVMANISMPHRPWKNLAESYDGEKPSLDEIDVFDYLPDTPTIRRDIADYFINIMYGDRVVGGVIDALEEAGVMDETLVILTSDQGAGFQRAKASAYYEGTHIPMIINGPGIKPGTSDELVSLVDLLPTMLEVFDIEKPEGQLQGASLNPILKGKAKSIEGRDYIFTEHNSHGPVWNEFYPSRAVFDGRYYFIRNLMPEKGYTLPGDLYLAGKPWYNLAYQAVIDAKDEFPEHYMKLRELETNRPPYELYDMESDPAQHKNLYTDPEYIDVAKRMQAALEAWRTETSDTQEVLDDMVESFGKPIPYGEEVARRNKLKQQNKNK